MFDRILALAEPAFLACSTLPFAVYLASEDGVFLLYNEEACELFDLPPRPTLRDNVADYYMHPHDRRENLRRLSDLARGEWLKNTTIDLRVGGRVKYVRDYTRAIWDEERGEIVALLCLMINITRGDRYHRLFNDLPVGIFSFRAGAGLVNANPRFLEMHGYRDFEEVRHREPSTFIHNPGELKELEDRLQREGSINNEYQEHVRRDGSVFTAAVSARAIRDSDGRWVATEGILEDVTMEALYFRLVNEVPIGLYTVRINERGEHLLVHCNQRFAANRGSRPEDLIGRDLRDFHRSPQAFAAFYDELLRRDQDGQELVDYILEAYNGQNVLRRYEVHIKLLKDAGGNITGRVGAERDVTDFLETKQQLEELTTDIGKVLHSYSSTLIHSKQTMDAVVRSLAAPGERRPDTGQVEEEPVLAAVHQQVAVLGGIIDKVLEKNRAVGHFGEATAGQFLRLRELMNRRDHGQIEVQQLALIRDAAIRTREMIDDIAAGNFPRELIKQGQRQLREILRLCSLVTLSRGVDAVLEMETAVNNLRSYILAPVKHKEPRQRLDLYDLLLGVIRKMEEYATHRNVDLRPNLKTLKDAYLDGYEDELVRALLNVLHNAVKYSWTRRGPARAYVTIDGRLDEEWIYLNVENWGVAITAEELEKGLIFKVGYRGVNSGDRRRPGTGLGLYDARKVVEKHDGELIVTSEPSLGNPRDDYSNPFVTTVRIRLPRAKS